MGKHMDLDFTIDFEDSSDGDDAGVNENAESLLKAILEIIDHSDSLDEVKESVKRIMG